MNKLRGIYMHMGQNAAVLLLWRLADGSVMQYMPPQAQHATSRSSGRWDVPGTFVVTISANQTGDGGRDCDTAMAHAGLQPSRVCPGTELGGMRPSMRT